MNQEENILGVIQGALALRSHRGLFEWLQKDVQAFLPHDILIAAWGDFASEQLCLDVVSPLPGIRTTEIRREDLQPLLGRMFEAWEDEEFAPFSIALDGQAPQAISGGAGNVVLKTIARMRGAVVHGIKDERGWHDCLYVALGREPRPDPAVIEAMELLLPHIDAAFRQVTHLPAQRRGIANIKVHMPEAAMHEPAAGRRRNAGEVLSEREQEIMRWVSIGKTNLEIGLILGISPSTVRNHLQRVFRKLDVMNRAQAVFQLEQAAAGKGGQ